MAVEEGSAPEGRRGFSKVIVIPRHHAVGQVGLIEDAVRSRGYFPLLWFIAAGDVAEMHGHEDVLGLPVISDPTHLFPIGIFLAVPLFRGVVLGVGHQDDREGNEVRCRRHHGPGGGSIRLAGVPRGRILREDSPSLLQSASIPLGRGVEGRSIPGASILVTATEKTRN